MPRIDETDRKILEVVLENSRTSLRKIASEVGLKSPDAVRKRLNKLKENNMVKYTASLNPSHARKMVFGLIMLKGTKKTECGFEGILSKVLSGKRLKIPQYRLNPGPAREGDIPVGAHVLGAFDLAGVYDIGLLVGAKDILELLDIAAIINEYSDTETLVINLWYKPLAETIGGISTEVLKSL